MQSSNELIGECLCKKVKITVTNVALHVDACHCSMCRKWSGSPLLSVDCGQNVNIQGQDYITTYDSSEWAQRGFCQQCGTHLFYQLKPSQQYIVPVGLFDSELNFEFTTQIFIEEKPDSYNFSNQTKTMTGEEVFAAYNNN